MIWLTADQHIGHKNIIKYTGRPFSSVEQMNETLISNWNNTIAKTDTVYFLGDLAFFKRKDDRLTRLAKSLNGRIIFIKGNHDPPQNILEDLPHVEAVDISMILEYEGIKYFLVHRPIMARSDMATLCGHVHEKWRALPMGTQIKEFRSNSKITLHHPIVNVGVDVWDFKPVSMNEIVDLLKNKKFDKKSQLVEE